ncbi:DUF4864 domain-containing protein [Mesorhizobium sp. SB112]|uniref:DUF4864 domain-containing protein n=1 Tax=Mesorhizobium sp. SB112 TaxID=3151853 RepID=UPI0032678458
MLRSLIVSGFVLAALSTNAFTGEAEVKGAQSVIGSQLEAFQSNNESAAYNYAAPNVKRIFPTVDSFMSMVTNAYKPVRQPKSFAFGKSEENGGKIVQQVYIVGPDSKDYEALYTLEQQPDGSWLITGVSLRASNALSI